MKTLQFLQVMGCVLMPSILQAQDTISNDYITQVPALDLTHALQDRVAGIDFENPDVRPGTSLNMNIRGLRDYCMSNDPLIVLNGISYQYVDWILDIDPAEIVSIQVLKDAATAALYGSQARHGAILINTRQKTAPLQRPHFTYEGYVAAKTASFRYPLMNADQLKQYRNEMGIDPSHFYKEATEGDIDRQDIYETAWTNRHKLSMTTGWKSGHIRAGLGLTNDASIMPIDNYRRYTIHADLYQNIGQYANMDISTYYTDSKKAYSYEYESNSEQNLFPVLLTQSPFTDAEKYEELIHEKYSEKRTNTLYQSWSANVVCPWIEGLSYHFEGGFNTFWGKSGNWSRSWDLPSQSNNKWESVSYNITQLNLAHRVSYDKNWKHAHHLSLTAKFSNENLKLKEYYEGDIDENCRRIMQVYSAHYDFQKRFEIDWCTNLEQYKSGIEEILYCQEFDWKGSHSLHLQWNIHQEPFAEDWTWANLLSLRADQGLIRSPYVLNYNDKEYNYYRSYNIGIYFRLWQGRLSGTFDLYKQRNGNILRIRQLPSTSFSHYTTWGQSLDFKTENRGWELYLQGTAIDNLNGWTWQLELGLYANRNKLILKDYWGDGHPIRSYKDGVYDGIYNEGDPDCTAYNIGTVRAKGYTENGNIDDILRTYSLDPDLKGFFTSHIQWKHIYLNLTGAFQVGGYTYCNFYQNFTVWQESGNKPDLDLWTPIHTSGRFPTYYGGRFATSLYWYDATMCRIRNITLGFDISDKWASRIGLERLSIWTAVNNPFILHSDLHDELGIDPAPNSVKSATSGGFGWYNLYTPTPYVEMKYPTTRDYLIGLNITF